jgi:hypothetical protein
MLWVFIKQIRKNKSENNVYICKPTPVQHQTGSAVYSLYRVEQFREGGGYGKEKIGG